MFGKCAKKSTLIRNKIFIHNYKLLSIQLRLKTFAENNTLNIENLMDTF